jgi:phosphatidylethanolamine-binding protein (PEBP) family uncharacterized protein
MRLRSVAFQQGPVISNEERREREIAVRYTCDGADESPPMHWTSAPKGTAELVLLIIDLNHQSGRLFDWAVGRLSPSLHSIPAGRLPAGAVVGRNGDGQDSYWICPPKGAGNTYGVFLYAVPHRLGLVTGFDANAVYEKIGGIDLPQAQSGFVYQRR